MAEQPRALQLADELAIQDQCDFYKVCEEAAAELRRLHKENEKLNADIESWRMTLAAATTLGEKVTAENERLREALTVAAKAEREACAEVAESYEPRCDVCHKGVAAAIRARGEQEEQR